MGGSVTSHAGSRLFADLAEVAGLTQRFGEALVGAARIAGWRTIRGRVLVDLAVILADGGEAISDLAVLRDQRELFGPVASTACGCWARSTNRCSRCCGRPGLGHGDRNQR